MVSLSRSVKIPSETKKRSWFCPQGAPRSRKSSKIIKNEDLEGSDFCQFRQFCQFPVFKVDFQPLFEVFRAYNLEKRIQGVEISLKTGLKPKKVDWKPK